MTQTLGQNWQDVNDAALPVIGVPARTSNETIIAALDKHGDASMRMYGATTPDAKLYFAASRVKAGNGSMKVKPAIDDKMPDVAVSSVNLSTAATTGGTFQKEGGTLSFSAAVGFPANPYVRMVAALRSTGEINLKISAQAASVGALELPEVLLAGLDGDPIGWVDLEYATSGTLKTAGSATTVVQNEVSGTSRIFNIAGGGSGGGADRTYKITSFSATGCTIKGGYERVPGIGVLASGTGTTDTTAKADKTVNLSTVLTNSGLAAIGTINSAGAVRLTLVIDLVQLGSKTTLTDSLRQVYLWTEAMLRFKTELPEAIDPRRYVVLDEVYIPITVSAWTTAIGVTVPTRAHDVLSAYFPYAEPYSNQITTGSGLQTFSHNLTGEPQIVLAYYFDGANKNGVEIQNVLVHKSSTQLKVDASNYDITGGKYLEIKAFYIPNMPALAGSSRTFTSAWFTSGTGTQTVPHGLNDREDIRGYEVQHYDTVLNRVRNVDRSGLVVNFDDTNFYLEWTGLTPAASATNQYRIVAGGSPLPWAVPSDLGGYTKYVKRGPGSYATLTAALAAASAGDRILIYGNTAEVGTLTIPAGVEINQMPGTTVVITGTFGIAFSGAKGVWKGLNVQLNPTGTLAAGVAVTAADCWLEGWIELNAAFTVTDMINVSALGVRAKYELSVKRTAGTITNPETNNDGAGSGTIWGG